MFSFVLEWIFSINDAILDLNVLLYYKRSRQLSYIGHVSFLRYEKNEFSFTKHYFPLQSLANILL
jgi:hypothetical protein